MYIISDIAYFSLLDKGGSQRDYYCKRPILCLASSKILTPPPTPLSAQRLCTPHLCCGGRTHSPGGEGGGGSIFWRTQDTALYSTYIESSMGGSLHGPVLSAPAPATLQQTPPPPTTNARHPPPSLSSLRALNCVSDDGILESSEELGV